MSDSLKRMSDRDASQVHKFSFNEEDKSISTAGFLVGTVGRKITPTILTTTIANDTVNYAYSESGTALYTIQCVYTDGSRTTLISAERIA